MNAVRGPDGAFSVRRAGRDDAPALVRLIQELALFEGLPPPDAEGERRLVEDGFGAHPRFEAWLAFVPERPDAVGYAVVFETYSTFAARPSLYIEDVFVLPEYRGRGLGTGLLRHCIRLAKEKGCGRVEWTCLDWNTRAQAVYEGTVGARRMAEWLLYRLTAPEIERFLEGD